MANIENTIYNRNRTTQNTINKTKKEGDAVVDDNGVVDTETLETDTKNILAGATTLSDVESKNLSAVKNDLVVLGFYSIEVPAWYVTMNEAIRGMSLQPEEMASDWETYRKDIIGTK